jgi:cellulose synthase/poly-beta-1,6-N-acetylglucosamine synthase-like glycosyltransferase
LKENYAGQATKIFLISNYNEFFEQQTKEFCLQRATMQLDFSLPSSSVRKLHLQLLLTSHILIFTAVITFNANIFYILLYICSIISSLLKVYLFYVSFRKQKFIFTTFRDDYSYPLYSILIPLYHEPTKVKSVIQAMERLDYPKDKLEVKILAEADDLLTLRALSAAQLPKYIQVIQVPPSLPRTKPKALNYGLQFTTGEYLVVYDAEDLPEKLQLKKACILFNQLPEEYVCLQARLNFYNRTENWLTRLFSLEYYIWFNFLLPGLDKLNLPIPLGGTSNHFKMDFLKQNHGWDPYNVTEDAELGIRLYGQGYKTKMLDSITFEESLIDVDAWIYQRARWIKGFICTYYVYRKHRKSNRGKFTFLPSLTINIFLGFSVVNFLMFPIFCISPLIIEYKGILLFLRNLSIIIYVSFCHLTVACAMISMQKRFFDFTFKDIVVIIGWPFYFMLHSFASWRAVYELFSKPYEWNKTIHGKSKLEMNLND